MKKPTHKEKLFFGVFKTFEEYENYIDRSEDVSLDFLDDMKLLNRSQLIILAVQNCKNIRRN